MSGERPLAAWSDRRLGEWGRAICHQRRLPTHPELVAGQIAIVGAWAHRWRQRGPKDPFGRVELGPVEDLADAAAPHHDSPARPATKGQW